MRIAVWHNFPSGGGKRALFAHIRGLKERGHEIEVWCPPTADADYLPLSQLVPEHRVDLQWPTKQSRLDRALGGAIYPGRLEALRDHCRRCAAEIHRGGFDILFANSCQFSAASPIARFVELPSALYLQEPYRPFYEAMPRFYWLAPSAANDAWYDPRHLRRIWRDRRRIQDARLQVREEFENAKAFDRILVNSRFSREAVLRAYGLDAEVCYLGVDSEHFVDRKLDRENFVIGVGAFAGHKNVSLIIEAIGLLPQPRPRLVWVGNARSRGYLEKMVTLAASRDVPFEPLVKIEDDQLIYLLNRAAAMVYAPRLEPFGLAPIEAGACGLPVVAVAEGGIRESVVDGVTGLLVESSPAEVADAVQRLLQNPELARTLGANGRAAAADQWSFQAATDRIEQKLVEVARSAKSVARRDGIGIDLTDLTSPADRSRLIAAGADLLLPKLHCVSWRWLQRLDLASLDV